MSAGKILKAGIERFFFSFSAAGAAVALVGTLWEKLKYTIFLNMVQLSASA
jgi:hypothetical protein